MLRKYRIFLLIILVTSVFSVTLSSNFLKYTSNTEASPDMTIELFDLKSSGPQINITTPENKTYYGPMRGYYPATYGFENDEVDSVPFGWTDESVGPTWVKVIASEDGHNNVLQLYDTTGGDPYAINAIGNKEYGTVEFWMKNVDMTEKAYFAPRNGATHLFRVLLADNMVTVTAQGGTGYDLAAATADTWHHFSVDFECGTGGYKGLGQYEFSVTYNGMRYGPYNFWNNAPYANNTAFSGFPGSGNYYYVDAVGYSWDPSYNIEDNLNEGLLLSYENSTSLDWLGYSLDNQANKTILGNTTIPLPAGGTHSIQVFGNNSIGTNFQSDIRYFSVKHIKMITPENKTYYQPMSGYYPATYGFENDEINSIPEEWSDLSDPSTNATIIASQSGHNKVLKLQDNSGSGYTQIYQIFNDGGKQSGTVELFVRKNFDSGASGICIQLLDSTQTAMYIYADASNDGIFGHYNGTGNEFSPGLYSDDTWFHIRFDFETGMGGYQGLNPDTFDLYINGVKRLSDTPFWNPTTEVTQLYLFTQNMNTGSWYADAIGYSWDPNYNIGDNLNEGLLLSYYTEFNFNWIGFSLDNQANKTIFGNTTISFPSEGFHTIQIFGNHSSSTLYESEMRYFSIDTLAPTSVISFTPYTDPNIVIRSTVFNITADDGLGSGVSLIRYKINNSIWYDYLGPFNLSSYEYGIYDISYYAIDNVGHIESENSIEVTLIPEPSEPSEPGIPGYHLVVIICIISIVSAVIIKKRFKSQF